MRFQFEKLENKRNEILDDLLKSFEASERAGTITARALVARKIAIAEDMSLSGLMVRKRKAKGSALTREEVAEITKKHSELEKAKQEYEAKIENYKRRTRN